MSPSSLLTVAHSTAALRLVEKLTSGHQASFTLALPWPPRTNPVASPSGLPWAMQRLEMVAGFSDLWLHAGDALGMVHGVGRV